MSELQTITLGGGCFWCTEAVYVKVRGVTRRRVGLQQWSGRPPEL